ncbi:MAG: ribosome assembly RNA-binding protein YhbY [Oscillospiraceae bacterium]|nr:ribosome assembly RNA-binding protein YhbY [Oscillospiraceae bacterium]
MLTSKQRAYLRGLASTEDPITQVGKNGITDNLIEQVNNALKARELVKLSVLDTAPVTPQEAAAELAEACKAEVVTTIGSKLVLFKRNAQEPKITLPKRALKTSGGK